MPQAWEDYIIHFFEQIYTSVGWFGVVIGMAIERACIPLPSEVIMPLSGWFLIQKPGLDPLLGVNIAGLAGGVGCTIGSIAAYAVGYYGGRPAIVKYGKYIRLNHHHLDQADRFFSKYGSATAFFSRLLPVVRTFISLPAGITRMNFPKFVAYTFVGSYIWSALLAWIGYILGANWTEFRAAAKPFDIPIIIIVLLVLIYFFVKFFRSGNKAETISHSGTAADSAVEQTTMSQSSEGKIVEIASTPIAEDKVAKVANER